MTDWKKAWVKRPRHLPRRSGAGIRKSIGPHRWKAKHAAILAGKRGPA